MLLLINSNHIKVQKSTDGITCNILSARVQVQKILKFNSQKQVQKIHREAMLPRLGLLTIENIV